MSQKGVVHLLALILITAVALLLFLFLSKKLALKTLLPKKEPKVELQTQYKNPLVKESQFVNPFSRKNPFDYLTK